MLSFTLLSDGSSDRALMPVLTWLLRQYLPRMATQGSWADLRRLPRPPRTLVERIIWSIELYPCDLLFVHRDAERVAHPVRVAEIREALDTVSAKRHLPPAVCVVPVRMQEAWLLFDEAAIRAAAGNPYGRQPLALPRLRDVEALPDPKEELYRLLQDAQGNYGRGRRRARIPPLVHRVAELIEDFAPLRDVAAFAALEHETAQALSEQGWL